MITEKVKPFGLLILILLAPLILISKTSSFERFGDQRKWDEYNIPVRYEIGLSVPTNFHTAINVVRGNWNNITPKFGFIPVGLFEQPKVTINYLSFFNIDAGRTVTSLETDGINTYITGAAIEYNSDYPWWDHPYTQDDTYQTMVSLYTVAAHEFGHAAGLDHSNDENALMAEAGEPSTYWIRREFTQDDIVGLATIYDPEAVSSCKPVIANEYVYGAGATNWIYVTNVARSAGVLGENYNKFVDNYQYAILSSLSNDFAFKSQVEKFSERIGFDLHKRLVEGKDLHIPITKDYIVEFDAILDKIESQNGSDSFVKNLREILVKSEGESFWSIFTDDIPIQVEALPVEPKLYQNSPNPFNPSTTIHFEISTDSFAQLQIFSPTGQLVKNLVVQNMSAGNHSVQWDGKNDLGKEVSSGVYISRLTIPSLSFVDQKKITLMK